MRNYQGNAASDVIKIATGLVKDATNPLDLPPSPFDIAIFAWCGAKFDFKATCEIGLRRESDCFGGLPDGFAGFQVAKGLTQAVASNIGGWGVTRQNLEFSLQLAFAYTHFFRHRRKVKIPAREILLQNAVKLVKEHIGTTSRSDFEFSSHTADILILPDRKRY